MVKANVKDPILKKLIAIFCLGGASWIFFVYITKPLIDKYLGQNPLWAIGVAFILVYLAYKLIGRDIRF